MSVPEIIEIIWTVALAIVAVVAGTPILFILFVFVLAVVTLLGVGLFVGICYLFDTIKSKLDNRK